MKVTRVTKVIDEVTGAKVIIELRNSLVFIKFL